jgi:hypothetical protein
MLARRALTITPVRPVSLADEVAGAAIRLSNVDPLRVVTRTTSGLYDGGQGIHSFSRSIAVGHAQGLIGDDTAAFVATHARELDDAVDHDADLPGARGGPATRGTGPGT